MSTGIQWTDETWNPIAAFDAVTGKRGWYCAHVSPGRINCYAEAMNRFRGNGLGYSAQNAKHVRIDVIEKLLLKPLSWRKPRRVFVCSMTDLFLDEHTDEMIDRVFAIMALTPHITYQVLTKRPGRALAYMSERFQRRTDNGGGPVDRHGKVMEAAESFVYGSQTMKLFEHDRWWTSEGGCIAFAQPWPLRNVWLGVTVEDQRRAEERIPLLLDTPAAVRFLSCEPLLESIDFRGRLEQVDNTGDYVPDRIRWVIVGGESGRGARPFDAQWARGIVDQCRRAGVAAFVKQFGANSYDSLMAWKMVGREFVPTREHAYQLARYAFSHSHGGDMGEWPEDLRVREFPRVEVAA